jgi:hypothetical protein
MPRYMELTTGGRGANRKFSCSLFHKLRRTTLRFQGPFIKCVTLLWRLRVCKCRGALRYLWAPRQLRQSGPLRSGGGNKSNFLIRGIDLFEGGVENRNVRVSFMYIYFFLLDLGGIKQITAGFQFPPRVTPAQETSFACWKLLFLKWAYAL